MDSFLVLLQGLLWGAAVASWATRQVVSWQVASSLQRLSAYEDVPLRKLRAHASWPNPWRSARAVLLRLVSLSWELHQLARFISAINRDGTLALMASDDVSVRQLWSLTGAVLGFLLLLASALVPLVVLLAVPEQYPQRSIHVHRYATAAVALGILAQDLSGFTQLQRLYKYEAVLQGLKLVLQEDGQVEFAVHLAAIMLVCIVGFVKSLSMDTVEPELDMATQSLYFMLIFVLLLLAQMWYTHFLCYVSRSAPGAAEDADTRSRKSSYASMSTSMREGGMGSGAHSPAPSFARPFSYFPIRRDSQEALMTSVRPSMDLTMANVRGSTSAHDLSKVSLAPSSSAAATDNSKRSSAFGHASTGNISAGLLSSSDASKGGAFSSVYLTKLCVARMLGVIYLAMYWVSTLISVQRLGLHWTVYWCSFIFTSISFVMFIVNIALAVGQGRLYTAHSGRINAIVWHWLSWTRVITVMLEPIKTHQATMFRSFLFATVNSLVQEDPLPVHAMQTAVLGTAFLGIMCVRVVQYQDVSPLQMPSVLPEYAVVYGLSLLLHLVTCTGKFKQPQSPSPLSTDVVMAATGATGPLPVSKSAPSLHEAPHQEAPETGTFKHVYLTKLCTVRLLGACYLALYWTGVFTSYRRAGADWKVYWGSLTITPITTTMFIGNLLLALRQTGLFQRFSCLINNAVWHWTMWTRLLIIIVEPIDFHKATVFRSFCFFCVVSLVQEDSMLLHAGQLLLCACMYMGVLWARVAEYSGHSLWYMPLALPEYAIVYAIILVLHSVTRTGKFNAVPPSTASGHPCGPSPLPGTRPGGSRGHGSRSSVASLSPAYLTKLCVMRVLGACYLVMYWSGIFLTCKRHGMHWTTHLPSFILTPKCMITQTLNMVLAWRQCNFYVRHNSLINNVVWHDLNWSRLLILLVEPIETHKATIFRSFCFSTLSSLVQEDSLAYHAAQVGGLGLVLLGVTCARVPEFQSVPFWRMPFALPEFVVVYLLSLLVHKATCKGKFTSRHGHGARAALALHTRAQLLLNRALSAAAAYAMNTISKLDPLMRKQLTSEPRVVQGRQLKSFHLTKLCAVRLLSTFYLFMYWAEILLVARHTGRGWKAYWPTLLLMPQVMGFHLLNFVLALNQTELYHRRSSLINNYAWHHTLLVRLLIYCTEPHDTHQPFLVRSYVYLTVCALVHDDNIRFFAAQAAYLGIALLSVLYFHMGATNQVQGMALQFVVLYVIAVVLHKATNRGKFRDAPPPDQRQEQGQQAAKPASPSRPPQPRTALQSGDQFEDATSHGLSTDTTTMTLSFDSMAMSTADLSNVGEAGSREPRGDAQSPHLLLSSPRRPGTVSLFRKLHPDAPHRASSTVSNSGNALSSQSLAEGEASRSDLPSEGGAKAEAFDQGVLMSTSTENYQALHLRRRAPTDQRHSPAPRRASYLFGDKLPQNAMQLHVQCLQSGITTPTGPRSLNTHVGGEGTTTVPPSRLGAHSPVRVSDEHDTLGDAAPGHTTLDTRPSPAVSMRGLGLGGAGFDGMVLGVASRRTSRGTTIMDTFESVRKDNSFEWQAQTGSEHYKEAYQDDQLAAGALGSSVSLRWHDEVQQLDINRLGQAGMLRSHSLAGGPNQASRTTLLGDHGAGAGPPDFVSPRLAAATGFAPDACGPLATDTLVPLLDTNCANCDLMCDALPTLREAKDEAAVATDAATSTALVRGSHGRSEPPYADSPDHLVELTRLPADAQAGKHWHNDCALYVQPWRTETDHVTTGRESIDRMYRGSIGTDPNPQAIFAALPTSCLSPRVDQLASLLVLMYSVHRSVNLPWYIYWPFRQLMGGAAVEGRTGCTTLGRWFILESMEHVVLPAQLLFCAITFAHPAWYVRRRKILWAILMCVVNVVNRTRGHTNHVYGCMMVPALSYTMFIASALWALLSLGPRSFLKFMPYRLVVLYIVQCQATVGSGTEADPLTWDINLHLYSLIKRVISSVVAFMGAHFLVETGPRWAHRMASRRSLGPKPEMVANTADLTGMAALTSRLDYLMARLRHNWPEVLLLPPLKNSSRAACSGLLCLAGLHVCVSLIDVNWIVQAESHFMATISVSMRSALVRASYGYFSSEEALPPAFGHVLAGVLLAVVVVMSLQLVHHLTWHTDKSAWYSHHSQYLSVLKDMRLPELDLAAIVNVLQEGTKALFKGSSAYLVMIKGRGPAAEGVLTEVLPLHQCPYLPVLDPEVDEERGLRHAASIVRVVSGCQHSVMVANDARARTGALAVLDDLVSEMSCAAALCVPMCVSEDIRGGLLVVSPAPDSYCGSYLRVCSDLTNQLSNVLYVKQRLEEAQAGAMIIQDVMPKEVAEHLLRARMVANNAPHNPQTGATTLIGVQPVSLSTYSLASGSMLTATPHAGAGLSAGDAFGASSFEAWGRGASSLPQHSSPSLMHRTGGGAGGGLVESASYGGHEGPMLVHQQLHPGSGRMQRASGAQAAVAPAAPAAGERASGGSGGTQEGGGQVPLGRQASSVASEVAAAAAAGGGAENRLLASLVTSKASPTHTLAANSNSSSMVDVLQHGTQGQHMHDGTGSGHRTAGTSSDGTAAGGYGSRRVVSGSLLFANAVGEFQAAPPPAGAPSPPPASGGAGSSHDGSAAGGRVFSDLIRSPARAFSFSAKHPTAEAPTVPPPMRPPKLDIMSGKLPKLDLATPGPQHGAGQAVVYKQWHANVSVLFADIVGYTSMSQELEPEEVMLLLHELFTKYDALCDQFGVYKVETIGDCYMAATGLIHATPFHGHNIVRFGRAMLAAASTVRNPLTGDCVRIRVGVHSGRVMSGIVGAVRARYCVFGDTVNTASRMESTGMPGRIQISDDVYKLLRGSEEGELWENRGEIEVKGKGKMRTWISKEDWGAGPSAASPALPCHLEESPSAAGGEQQEAPIIHVSEAGGSH